MSTLTIPCLSQYLKEWAGGTHLEAWVSLLCSACFRTLFSCKVYSVPDTQDFSISPTPKTMTGKKIQSPSQNCLVLEGRSCLQSRSTLSQGSQQIEAQQYSAYETLSGVLCPDIESSVQERHGPVTVCPQKDHKIDPMDRTPPL